MFDLIATAIPFFLAMMLIEAIAYRFDDDHEKRSFWNAFRELGSWWSSLPPW
jgi:hypothetical protein